MPVNKQQLFLEFHFRIPYEITVLVMVSWMVSAARDEPHAKFHSQICTINQHMMTSSNGNIFRVTGHLCGNPTVPGEFPTQRPVTRSFDVYFDLRPNKLLSKQSWDWWFETPSRPLWRHRNDKTIESYMKDNTDWCHATAENYVFSYMVHHISSHICLAPS